MGSVDHKIESSCWGGEDEEVHLSLSLLNICLMHGQRAFDQFPQVTQTLINILHQSVSLSHVGSALCISI